MVSSNTFFIAGLSALIATSSASAIDGGSLVKRDGSTITVSTTQFNSALTNQGGTTNSAGTFNVSPLATSTSYQFQTVEQTSTFQVASVTPQSTSSNNNNNNNNDGNSGDTSGSSSTSGDIGGGTVVITATAPTSTISMVGVSSSSISSTGSASASASNGLPSLAFGASSNNGAIGALNSVSIMLAMSAIILGTLWGAFMV
ncbi:uncharacterized protein MEPE_04092 [Melanopsichium pennsylvanicum]|uniref:Uncharacterized protein n=1 Tax=Melanopsichium pennsylvanicum TaxID=63383 RepID=A0AAJ4XNI1_9BASI|nr:uncharacterized protein MEPE_04092 [Melanopsichium pennsylvanicum]